MKQFKSISFFFILTAVLSACGNNSRTARNTDADSLTVKDSQTLNVKPVLPPLEEGDLNVTDDEFGETINLTGEPLNIKENIKPDQLFVKGDYLITKNKRRDSIFMIFELPSLKCMAAFGIQGNGPDEFNFPRIVETAEDSILFYIFEMNNSKVYKVSKRNFRPEYYLTLSKGIRSFDDRQMVFISSKAAYYASSAARGKMIYSFNSDSLPQEKPFIDLSILGIKGSWTTLIGDFGLNPNFGRIAYAYKYFKRLKIVDMQTMKEKQVVFKAKELEKGLNDIATLEPTNITHYWGMSANHDFFWMLYSGRTPVDVQRDNRSNKKYIYVEKFDWNGTPINRYKLDDWGWFCVDKQNETLYLAPTVSIYSLLRYKIPESNN